MQGLAAIGKDVHNSPELATVLYFLLATKLLQRFLYKSFPNQTFLIFPTTPSKINGPTIKYLNLQMTPSIPPLIKKIKIKGTNLTTARQDILSRFQLEHLTVYDQYDICADGIRKERQPETWTFSVSLRAF